MHVSETPLARGDKPQDHYKEGDAIHARILRIEDADMKVGLSGVALDEAAPAAAPEAPAAPPEASAAAPEAAAAPGEEPAPKKKRTRIKKADEPAKE